MFSFFLCSIPTFKGYNNTMMDNGREGEPRDHMQRREKVGCSMDKVK